jgi:hypothetical protein
MSVRTASETTRYAHAEFLARTRGNMRGHNRIDAPHARNAQTRNAQNCCWMTRDDLSRLLLRLLAACAEAEDIYSVTLCGEAVRKPVRMRKIAKVRFVQVVDRLTPGANHVVVQAVVHLHAQRAVMHADLPKEAAGDEQMDVLVHGGEGYRRNALLDKRIYLFRTGMAGYALHHLKQHLTLMRNGDAVFGAKVPEGSFLPRNVCSRHACLIGK